MVSRIRGLLVRWCGVGGAVNSIALSADGKRALSGSRDKTVKRDVERGSVLKTERSFHQNSYADGYNHPAASVCRAVRDGLCIIGSRRLGNAISADGIRARAPAFAGRSLTMTHRPRSPRRDLLGSCHGIELWSGH